MTSATRKEKEMLKRSSSMGDTSADLALKDIHEEEAEYAEDFHPPKKGDWVIVFTMGFHFAGRITGMDHEWIGLAANHAWINNSGSVEAFEKGNFSDWELCKLPGYVAKGSIFKIEVLEKPLVLKK